MTTIVTSNTSKPVSAPIQPINQTKTDRIKNIFIGIYQYPTLPLIGAGLGVAFGSIANLSIPVASLLGLGLGAISSSFNQAFFRVRPRPDPKVTSGVQPEIEKDPRCQAFQILKDRIHKKEPIYLISEGVLQEEKLLKILGKGGCKKAIELERGRALIVPNMDVEVDFFSRNWEGIVGEEVAMSQLLTKIGMLSPLSQKVRISLSASDEETIPAYLSETFESLGKTKGWFIIDTKNSKSSTWQQGKDFLFNSEEDRLNKENWDLISNSLLDDVAKMCIYDIPTLIDSINVAIVKKTSGLEISPYEIRYFGFDFSSKNCSLSIPTIQERSKEPDMGKVEGVLSTILDQVFYCEFDKRYGSGTEHATLWGFKNSLVKKYSKEVVIRVNKMHPISNKL
jgi:hypothetical protein